MQKVYVKGDSVNVKLIDFDKEHPERPHWIKVTTSYKTPRFVSISTTGNAQLFYKSFGGIIHYLIRDIPEQNVTRTFINTVAEQFDDVAGGLNTQIAKRLFGEVQKLNLSHTANILDLGAGTGLASIPFIENGFNQLTLLDFSKEMKRVALNKPVLKKVNYVIRDAKEDFRLRSSFELVISSMMLCDLTDNELNKVLDNTLNVMLDGAYFAIVEDQHRTYYSKKFQQIKTTKINVGEYEKYLFIGQKTPA